MKFGRRQFIAVTALAGAATVAAKYWSPDYQAGIQRLLAKLLSEKLSYVKFSDEDIRGFIADYRKFFPYEFSIANIVGWTRFDLIGAELRSTSSFLDTSYAKVEEHLTTQLLLGSDYFYKESAALKHARYLGKYSPRHNPCRNPFAKF